jgi:hypothetical protein
MQRCKNVTGLGKEEGAMKKLRIYFIAGVCLLATFGAVPSGAALVEGVRFAPEFKTSDQVLDLTGAGLLRYMGFIKAYVGALYLPQGVDPKDALTDTAKRLEVEYFHAIDGEDFGPATIEGISQNVDPKTLERLMPKIEYHNSLYVDVRPGDRYALTYIPGRGTELSLNGRSMGVIEGAEFARALFSIWLGPEPISDSLKTALLGQR